MKLLHNTYTEIDIDTAERLIEELNREIQQLKNENEDIRQHSVSHAVFQEFLSMKDAEITRLKSELAVLHEKSTVKSKQAEKGYM